MKVILQSDIKGTGVKGQVIEVSDGYARNYLLPRKMAIEATAVALNAVENAKSAIKHREETRLTKAEATARELKGKVIQITARSGEGGRLYGSITTAEIAEKLSKQYGIDVGKQKIELEEPIKRVGQSTIVVRLSPGVATRMLVNVTAE